MLILHIAVALLGLGVSTWLYINPSKNKINLSSGLLGITLVSGISLIFLNSASILRTCLTGLAYTAFVTAMLYVSSKKLAVEKD